MKITFKVDNFNCGDYASQIKAGLLKLPGVSAVEVDLDKGQVCVTSDRQTSLEDIVKGLYLLADHRPDVFDTATADQAIAHELE